MYGYSSDTPVNKFDAATFRAIGGDNDGSIRLYSDCVHAAA